MMRMQTEMVFEKMNEDTFRGSISPQKAKQIINKVRLKFGNFTNFDGVKRF
jgi:hypothetical protein